MMVEKLLHRRDVAILLSVGTILLVWQILATVINSPLILPLPKETFEVLIQDMGKPLFWQHVGATACRSLVAFVISVVVGTLLGVASGASESVHNLLDFPLAMMRATPVVSFILLALFWFAVVRRLKAGKNNIPTHSCGASQLMKCLHSH